MNKLAIGQRIRKEREALGYTRETLAELIDVTPRFCYDLELGNKGMSIDTLCLLSETLKVSTDYILFGKSESAPGKSVEVYLSLILSCPEEKREHLLNIITAYLQAVR